MTLERTLALLDTVRSGIHKAGAGYQNHESGLHPQILVMKARTFDT